MNKISSDHLGRRAYIYIRQSTLGQVHHNLENQRGQYALADRARELGWHDVEVIDDDLGRSGAGVKRPGFERLLGGLCDGRVGAVFCVEASRLARNGRDWHTLLEFCSVVGALLIDADGIYDPRDPNDRLLLGMKGQISEMELANFRARAQAALAQKAQRGDLIQRVAVGYVRTDNRLKKSPDARVREAIELVFRKFNEFGSVRRLYFWLSVQTIQLPRVSDGFGKVVRWQDPRYHSLLSLPPPWTRQRPTAFGNHLFPILDVPQCGFWSDDRRLPLLGHFSRRLVTSRALIEHRRGSGAPQWLTLMTNNDITAAHHDCRRGGGGDSSLSPARRARTAAYPPRFPWSKAVRLAAVLRGSDARYPFGLCQGLMSPPRFGDPHGMRNRLQNPVNAGTYVYGRTRTSVHLAQGHKHVSRMKRRDPKDWRVLITEHHEGYISWDDYQRNQTLIAHNAVTRGDAVRGAVRSGPALLVGLLRCGHCGRKLHVEYPNRGHTRYACMTSRLDPESLGRATPDDIETIKDSAAAWSAAWSSDRAADFETEREKWDSDWSLRTNDLSGYRHILTLAERFGVDTTPQRHAAAVAEFGAVPESQECYAALSPLPPPSGKSSGLRLLTPAECETADGRRYVVKGLLAERDVACIFGPPGAGKSIVAPHLAYAVAQGRQAFGRRVRQGKAFYIAAEDSHGMRQRVRGLRLSRGDAPTFALVEGVGSLLDDADATALRALVAEHRPAVIFIDTLAMAFPGIDKNTSQDMGRVVALARSLTEHSAAVVLIHHDTKAQDGTPRGHSLLNGALDVSLLLGKADDNGVIRGKLVKNRNGVCDDTLAFRIRSVQIGEDEDGDAITAPVADELADAGARPDKLPRGATAALGILREMLSGGSAVVENDWRQACCEDRRVSTSDERKSRAKAFQRAYAELIDHEFILAADGLVSLASAAAEFA